MAKIALFGGGAWGSTLSQCLVESNHQVTIYEKDKNKVDSINQHIHPVFKSKLGNITAKTKVDGFLDCDYIFLAVPTFALRDLFKELSLHINSPKVFVTISKGIEVESFKRYSQVIEEIIPGRFIKGYVVLSGPGHAEEVTLKHFTAQVSACEDIDIAEQVQALFTVPYLRIYSSTDIVSAELGAMIKNALAVVSGIAFSLNLGENAIAALMTRGLAEMARIILFFGGTLDAVYGLTGLGDLMVTANSNNSRNFRAGKQIGMGKTLDDIIKEEPQTIEGFRSITALHLFSTKVGMELPIINCSWEIIYNGLPINEGLSKLFSRAVKREKI